LQFSGLFLDVLLITLSIKTLISKYSNEINETKFKQQAKIKVPTEAVGLVNNLFEYELKKYMPGPEMVNTFKVIRRSLGMIRAVTCKTNQSNCQADKGIWEEKLSYIRDHLFIKAIEA